MATLIAITSDQHCGSTVALCPPVIRLDDGGEYHASPAQRWLWEAWTGFWRHALTLRERHRCDRLIHIWNGDLVDGDHHGTSQILSGNPVAQSMVVHAAVSVALATDPDDIAFVRGTEAHVGKSACAEERAASGLRADGWPIHSEAATGNASHWHLKLEVEGVRIDCAHHGRVGTRPWTRPNVVTNLAAEIFYSHAATGQPHPHVAIRSHMHQYVDTGGVHPVRVIQTPAFQLATSYVHRIAPGALADVGGVFVVCEDGRAHVEPFLQRPDPVPTWRPA